MIYRPLIPIWIIGIFCLLLFLIRIKEKWGRWTQLLICILIFSINVRPMIPGQAIDTQESNLDVIFVVDNTISMHALDFNQDEERMVGVRMACEEIVTELAGARFSLISFSNSSQVMMPLTYDGSTILNGVETLKQIEESYARGSSLDAPLKDMEKILKSSSDSEEERTAIVFYISDGENNYEKQFASFSGLKRYVDDGVVLGFGTKEGGEMIFHDEYLGLYSDYIRNPYTGEKALSKLDEKNLRSIADDMDIDYVHYTSQGDLDSKLETIQSLGKASSNFEEDGAKDIYPYFLIPLAVILLIDWFIAEKKKGKI